MPTKSKAAAKVCSKLNFQQTAFRWLFLQTVLASGVVSMFSSCSLAMVNLSDNDGSVTAPDWRNASPKVLVQLIEGWGRHDLKYDENVVEFLLRDEFALTCLYVSRKPLDAFTKRLDEDDKLLGQLAWYRHWQAGNSLRESGMLNKNGNVKPSLKSRTLPIVKGVSILSEVHKEGERLSALILLASEFNRPDALKGLTPENLAERWKILFGWVKNNAPYFYYSKKHACYLLDQNAAKKKEAVQWERQNWPFPTTSLPKNAPVHH